MRILPSCQSMAEELAFLQKALDWSCKIKPEYVIPFLKAFLGFLKTNSVLFLNSEEFEPKVLLIWDKILELSVRQLDFSGDSKVIFKTHIMSTIIVTLIYFLIGYRKGSQ